MEFLRRLSSPITGASFTVAGTVVPGYEPVRDMFESYFRANMESRAQLCVYVDQEKVVGEKCQNSNKTILKFTKRLYPADLYGSRYYKDGFGPDSLVPVFSTSKVINF